MAIIESKITDKYAAYNGDAIEVTREMPDESVGLVTYSPPFVGLYEYSSDERDMSNNLTPELFFQHYDYLVKELSRVTKAGRYNAVHCVEVPIPGQKDGYYDLPGKIIEMYKQNGFIYQGRISIWREPLWVAISTRLIHLTHKQLYKDSSRLCPATPDYVLLFRKKGEPKDPVVNDYGLYNYAGDTKVPESMMPFRGQPFEDGQALMQWMEGNIVAEDMPEQKLNRLSQWIWRQYASPFWLDIRQNEILDTEIAREKDDEKHPHPLSLDVYRRLLHLFTNPNDIVLETFGGVGSGAYAAIENGRKPVSVELKPSYYAQKIKNIDNLVKEMEESKFKAVQGTLFNEFELQSGMPESTIIESGS